MSLKEMSIYLLLKTGHKIMLNLIIKPHIFLISPQFKYHISIHLYIHILPDNDCDKFTVQIKGLTFNR